MTPRLENAALSWHLDCNNFDLRNVGKIDVNGFVHDGDSRLRDPRAMLDGSVVDQSVSTTAFIQQSKLNLNEEIPSTWLGPIVSDIYAARGDLAEQLSHRGAINGYTPLDSGRTIPVANLTITGGTGTVNTVNLAVPPELKVGGTVPITSSGSFTVTLESQPDNSWFGVYTTEAGAVLKPAFTTLSVPMSIIPGLDTSKFTTGVFPINVLPKAVGVGASHAIGITPDPETSGDPDDYLGRDMQWHTFVMDTSYQPSVPNVNIFLASIDPKGGANVTIRSFLIGSRLFYRVNGGAFIESHVVGEKYDVVLTIAVQNGDFIEAYAAKAGYNNSAIETYTVAF